MFKVYKVGMRPGEPNGAIYDIPEGYRVDQIICANGEFVVMILEQVPERRNRPEPLRWNSDDRDAYNPVITQPVNTPDIGVTGGSLLWTEPATPTASGTETR